MLNQEPLDAHFSQHFDKTEFSRVSLQGPLSSIMPWFYVGKFFDAHTSWWIYYTNGCDCISYGVHQEFMILDREDRNRNVEILHWITLYCQTCPVNLGDVVELGEKWHEISQLDHLLVSLPYPFPQDLRVVSSAECPIEIMWLLPISKSEADYAKKRDIEALEILLETRQIEFTDYRRESVIK
jgi:hypothetical protein